MVARVDYEDDIEIVAISDGGCTHLFVAVRVDHDDDIMSLLLLLMVVTGICLWCSELILMMI